MPSNKDYQQNCLKGCIPNYYCPPLNIPGPADEQAESFAPIVEILIGGSNFITVGNQSFPADPHTAVIKSFEFGFIDSPEMKIEILDEKAGEFSVLVDALVKCAKLATGLGTELKARWGWTMTTCENTKKVLWSPWSKSILHQIEVNYSQGKIKYNLTCKTVETIHENLREDRTYGEDGKKMHLEDAIVALCNIDPSVRVRFCRRNKDGKLECGLGLFEWYQFGKKGPKEIWQADNESRYATISKWVAPYRIDDGSPEGKGIILVMDPLEKDQLIVLQDPGPNPGEPATACTSSIGSFIVNGGKCSPVIEFNPTFNWTAGYASFAAGGSTDSSQQSTSHYKEDAKWDNQEKPHGENVGPQTENTADQPSQAAYGPKEVHKETNKSMQAHLKASRITDINIHPIKADLKILGDPRPQFIIVDQWLGKTIGIIAINPFHISGSKNQGCGDWLAQPLCNEILSNKGWVVMGINHSIKEGSYTTTLKVFLPTPGIEIAHSDPLGGQGSNGATVENVCI
jgi:hypothetical protein